jgi:hypothetical protein
MAVVVKRRENLRRENLRRENLVEDVELIELIEPVESVEVNLKKIIIFK